MFPSFFDRSLGGRVALDKAAEVIFFHTLLKNDPPSPLGKIRGSDIQ